MTEWAKSKAYKAAGGCNEDCFNCPFPDCYKVSNLLKTNEAAKEALRVGGDTSQNRMYTLELGDVGRNMPNISKKNFCEVLIMINFFIGLVIGGVAGFWICSLLSANGRD